MQSLWNDAEAAAFDGPLAQRVYTSRLLGRDHALVLHGGGNTSVKIRQRNLFGDEEDVLYVKGSGWDLETIEPPGFAPVRLERALRLATLDHLSDTQMVQELRAAMVDPSAPTPSVETILHALLPFPFVDHTHADALLTVTNTDDGPRRVREIYSDSVVVVPYVMPGFDLARVVAEQFPKEATPNTVGLVLLNHGFFSFGQTAREAYERMIDLVSRAEAYLAAHGAWDLAPPEASLATTNRGDIVSLRRQVSDVAGAPMILATHSEAKALAFARRPDVGTISQQGPVTPDHVIRTRRVAQIGRDVARYATEYAAYFEEHAPAAQQPLKMLDPAPRVILDDVAGVMTIGRTAQDAAIAFDVYSQTIDVVLRATALGGYRALPASDIFAVEYWDLEQAKLRRGGSAPPFAGEIALVTGAASGIGKACAEAFLRRGAAVVGLDLNPGIREAFGKRADFVGLECDVRDPSAIDRALDAAVAAYGGLDMLVLNAGIFPSSTRIAALALSDWRRVMDVNLDANLVMLSAAYPLLKCAPKYGRVVVIGSKNVPAPGPGAAAYSAAKAAVNQLARVAALEWGADGIRVNVVHPNAVFDTGIWTEEVLQSRAASYGISVEEYRRNNVLQVAVTSRDVAEMVAEMCGPVFSRTTAAQVPVDGGNERVI
ncbi:MAG TPA: bifunctional aldolase/short-chain dehydrogenase [Chloroflexota bacterium]|jgi:rhamnose utilization protein RhaD (predicted bifunctional aldolase and dehydrogenase)/NAD(P)-dependent dehydrogenase (short-subunit alcohol dehydrogenase family)